MTLFSNVKACKNCNHTSEFTVGTKSPCSVKFYTASMTIKVVFRRFADAQRLTNEQQRQEKLPFNKKKKSLSRTRCPLEDLLLIAIQVTEEERRMVMNDFIFSAYLSQHGITVLHCTWTMRSNSTFLPVFLFLLDFLFQLLFLKPSLCCLEHHLPTNLVRFIRSKYLVQLCQNSSFFPYIYC